VAGAKYKDTVSYSVSDQAQAASTATAPPTGALTLDELFRRSVERQPDAIALIDPPNKKRITGSEPLQLTFAEADKAISAIATQFTSSGLPLGSIIAVQMPNTVEFALTALAALRAGLVVALLPQLWRQSELTTALNRVGARAIVSVSRIEIVDHADLTLHAAAEAFSIRNVFGFGNDLPEGMAPLEILTDGEAETLPAAPADALRPAIVSFDLISEGFRAVPRSHGQLIAGGLAIAIESGLPQGARLLSAMAPASFAGFASSIVMWLLNGGSLALHHPADIPVLEQQIGAETCDALIVPGLLALRLAESGAISAQSSIRHVIGLWRTPDRVGSSDNWHLSKTALTDVYLFGEIGLFGARRLDDGSPAQITSGAINAPRNAEMSKRIGEIILTPRGTLALRGSMVALAAYRVTWSKESFGEPSGPDYADTGYAAHIDRATGALNITAPPVGIVAVGGYRFLAQDLDEWAKRLTAGAMLTALPDQLNGFRLAGRASDNRAAREAFGELGLNPLMGEAFRERSSGT